MMPLSLAMQTIRGIKSHERSPMDYFFSAQRTRPKSAGGQAQACAAKGIGFQTAPFGGLDFFWRGSPALAPPRWEGCIFGSRQRARSQGQANASAVKVSQVRVVFLEAPSTRAQSRSSQRQRGEGQPSACRVQTKKKGAPRLEFLALLGFVRLRFMASLGFVRLP